MLAPSPYVRNGDAPTKQLCHKPWRKSNEQNHAQDCQETTRAIPHSDKPLDLAETNPGFLKELGTHDNCTHCVVAGFLRLHGYDVVATSTGRDEPYNASCFWKNGPMAELSLETLTADINEKMQEMGDGAVAQIRIPMSATSMNGHVFLAINKSDEDGVVLYDCQTGNSDNCGVTIANAPTESASHAWIMRLDDNELTENAKKCFKRSPNLGGKTSGQGS